MSDNNSFHNTLDELMELFKKIKEQSENGKLGDIDVEFIQDFDFVISNYQMIKNSISPEIMNQLGEPLQGLVKGLVEQLRDELKNVYSQGMPEQQKNDLEEELRKINEKLASDNISMKDIDMLLDKRSELLGKK